MSTSLYHNSQMEQELRSKIDAAANERHGGAVPADVQDRIAAEEQHIFDNGHGTLLAVAAKLAEFSESQGYPVGFRGLTGNLYLSHLLGLAAVDPMGLGLRWEGCLGLDGTRAPQFTLNVAGGLLEDMAAYLGELLPGYNPGDEHPAIRLCLHALMDRVWEARRAGSAPAVGDVLSDGSLVARAYRDDVAGIPMLGDLEGFQDFARQLEPETFSDLVKIMGLCLVPGGAPHGPARPLRAPDRDERGRVRPVRAAWGRRGRRFPCHAAGVPRQAVARVQGYACRPRNLRPALGYVVRRRVSVPARPVRRLICIGRWRCYAIKPGRWPYNGQGCAPGAGRRRAG